MSAIQDIGNSTEKSYFPTKGQDMRSRLIFINAVLLEKKVALTQKAHISEKNLIL